jgi:hypothetical protein
VTELLLHAAFPLPALAKAASMDRRTLGRLLEQEGVRCFHTANSVWVPLSELELKVPAFWESLKAAEMLRRSVEDEEGGDEESEEDPGRST